MLRYTLTAKQSYPFSQPVLIEFALVNQGPDSLWILKWYTPLEGIKGDIFQVTCNGQQIPYAGPLVKRGDPGPADYVRIGTRESAQVRVDLATAYALPEAGPCRVQFAGQIYDIVSDETLIPRSRGEHKSSAISGNLVSFKMVSR